MRASEKTNNRTGLAIAPKLAAELQATIPDTPPGALTGDGLALVRADYAEEAEPVGTMPPPASLGARDAAKKPAGEAAMVLMDKLGARLAFERSGVRLYQGLISKFQIHGSWKGGPSEAELRHMRDEEHEHFQLISRTMQQMGGDPTAVTPSADLHSVASSGLPAVIADPRTDLRESLEAILVAELVDNDCWSTLIDLAHAMGHGDSAEQFGMALDSEREHLEKVRNWLAAAMTLPPQGRRAAPASKVRAAPQAKRVARPKTAQRGGGKGARNASRNGAARRKSR